MIPRQEINEVLKGDFNPTSNNPIYNGLLKQLRNETEAAKNFLNCAKIHLYEETSSGVCHDQFG